MAGGGGAAGRWREHRRGDSKRNLPTGRAKLEERPMGFHLLAHMRDRERGKREEKTRPRRRRQEDEGVGQARLPEAGGAARRRGRVPRGDDVRRAPVDQEQRAAADQGADGSPPGLHQLQEAKLVARNNHPWFPIIRSMRISLCVFVCNLNRIGDETKGGWVEEVGRARHVFGEIPLRTPLRSAEQQMCAVFCRLLAVSQKIPLCTVLLQQQGNQQ
uniref:Uncharacterized protein n=1 Tax=Oryza glumipatula TaxID=40148 RepID=A0A0E0B6D0_9ORYZ